MRQGVPAVAAVVMVAGLLLTACVTGPQPLHTLTVRNGTTLGVTITVNGQVVAAVAPGKDPPAIDFSALPPRPWTVEARTPSGRVLATMRVNPGDGVPGSGGAMTVVHAEAQLSCGTLLILMGDSPPPGLPQEAPAFAPGDCAP